MAHPIWRHALRAGAAACALAGLPVVATAAPVATTAANTEPSTEAARGPTAEPAPEPATKTGTGPTGELRLFWTGRSSSTLGPLAAANARVPGIAPVAADALSAEAELRHTLRGTLAGTPLSLAGNLLAAHDNPAGRPAHSTLRANELYGSADFGAWQASAGKKVIGWDVGYGFRPNDFVQQETRRTLLSTTPEGRPLLQLERFGAEDALSLVWVNPERWNGSDDSTRGPRESALALRAYQRWGALDAFGFARQGAHTGSSVGTALAWVATDELELHASARWLRRHDGWRINPSAGDAPLASTPWQQTTRGPASQWLLGANWTGALQQSVMLEYWHDGTALPDAEWQRWGRRNQALAANRHAPALALAGNLAWQARPFDAPSLRQDNLFIRLAWQPEHWTLSFDALVTPSDRGRVLTAAAAWQGDHWRFNAAWRVNGGPADALLAQLPTRRSLLLAATRAF